MSFFRHKALAVLALAGGLEWTVFVQNATWPLTVEERPVGRDRGEAP